MIINEVYDKAVPEYQDVGDDNSTSYALRQTRLTLQQLNKLRRMNDMRQYEQEEKLTSIRAQYGTPAKDDMNDPF
jgi:hypothetical protein